MSLDISDVLDTGDLTELLSNEVQYSSLVKCFQSLTKSKIDLITKHHTTFLDLLLKACTGKFFNSFQVSPKELREQLNDALIQKLTVGLMALGKIKSDVISTEVFRMGNHFVSEGIIKNICRNNTSKFSAKQCGKEYVVQIATESNTENHIATTQDSEKEKTRFSVQLKHLYKTNPSVVQALQPKPTWKQLLSAYQYWYKYCHATSNVFFVDWLSKIATLESPANQSQYEFDLNSVIATTLRHYVIPCSRSVRQLVDHICLEKPQFLSIQRLMDIVKSDCKMYISHGTYGLPDHQKMVSLMHRVEKPRLHEDFQLPVDLERRINPMLTLRVTWDTMLNIFKIAIRTEKMQYLIKKYGCFLNYLVKYADASKPKLSVKEFEQHLRSLLKLHVLKCLEKSLCDGKLIKNILLAISPTGFIDSGFLRETAEYYSHVFQVDRDTILHRTSEIVTISDSEDEYKHVEADKDPLTDLESPRILHLLEKQPRFVDILDVFLSLPEISLSVLANSSMSFFEWLINLSKRIMPHDAAIFEFHLQNIVQEEVVRIHAKMRCQMTIHHVHSQLCLEHSMLLSPNFLRWCLEQPDSAFIIHQSWIYMKNSEKRPSSDASTSNSDSLSSITLSNSVPGRLLFSISSCSELLDLIKIIKEIPLEQVGSIIQCNSYWYDFMENNVKDRGMRRKLAVLLAEEAKFCLGKRIFRINELVSGVSNSVPNFVSSETLEYVLRNQMGMFALSCSASENCRVGVVREMGDNGVECCDEHEENLMRQILLYIPSSGFCDITTLLGLLTKEYSFMYNNSTDVDYLRCFFLIFPMLFYLRGDVVVLTCMALEKRNMYRTALHPTSTTSIPEVDDVSYKHRRRGKRSRHHRHKRSKRRRFSGRHSPSISSDEINTSSENISFESDANDATHSKSTLRPENKDSDKVLNDEKESAILVNVIEELPAELITDIAGSLLMNNNGQAKTDPLAKELLSMTVGSEECQKIRAVSILYSKFKIRMLNILDSSCKFAVRCKIVGDLETASDVVLFPEKGNQITYKTDAMENSTPSEMNVERVEVSSTNNKIGISKDSHPRNPSNIVENIKERKPSMEVFDPTQIEEDVIKLPPVVHVPVYTEQREEYVSKKLCVKSAKSTESTSITMTRAYSSLSTSGSYMKERPPSHTQKHIPKCSREEQFMEYFNTYLQVSAGVCSTELLISSAYSRFHEERFARSQLAFEAYVYDFLVQNCENFVLSGTGCEFGVSRIFGRRISPNSSPCTDSPTNLFFLQFVPTVCTSCCAYLNTRSTKHTEVTDLCEAINAEFSNHFGIFSDGEVAAVVRCLVLVTMIRNLKLFCFSVSEQSVYLRNSKEPEVKESTTRHHHKAEIEGIQQNATTRKAVLLMADILRTSKPSSRTALRNLWQSQAPAAVANVFGTGISFTLSLRKYSFLFPTLPDGSIKVDESALECINNNK